MAGAMMAAVLLAACGSGGAATTSPSAAQASVAAAPSVAASQGAPTELVLACYAGDIQKYLEEDVLPAFAKANNVKITYVPGVSTATMSKLQAQKDAPQIDVACLDDGPRAQAVTMGLLQPTDQAKLTNLGQVYDVAKFKDGIGVGWALFAVGLVYNPDAIAKAGVSAPTSWNALADPAYKGHVVVDSITTTYGLFTMLMLARANGGDVTAVDPGFAAMAKVKPNLITFDTTADMSPYFQQQGAWLGVWTDSEANAYANKTKFPMKFVVPSEGAPALMATANVVKGAPHAGLADALLDYLVSKDAQDIVAKSIGFGPVNQSVVLTPAEAANVTYGQDKASKLVQLDWSVINAKRSEWTDRWNKEVEN